MIPVHTDSNIDDDTARAFLRYRVTPLAADGTVRRC